MSAWIACCSLREGVLLFSGFQALTGLYWIGSSLDESHPWPSISGMAQVIISLLLLNSLSGFLAVRPQKDWSPPGQPYRRKPIFLDEPTHGHDRWGFLC